MTGQPEKVCWRAMERTCRRDLIDYGSSLNVAFSRQRVGAARYGPTRALIVTSHDPSAFCVAANMPPVSAPEIAPSTGTGTCTAAAHCR